MESILLDLKLSTEIQSYTELPAEVPSDVKEEAYTPFEESELKDDHASLNEYSSAIDHAINEVSEVSDLTELSEVVVDSLPPLSDAPDEVVMIESIHPQTSSASYDSMTIKELHALGKSRGIAGSSTMKKATIIDALKAADQDSAHSVTHSLTHSVTSGSNSFLETSSPFSNDA